MKKLVCLILTLLMVVCLTACGGDDKPNNDSISTKVNTESIEPEENIISVQTDLKENSNNDAEWKEFLKDYEEWVDDYIAIVKKQKENPTDMSILADYTKMLTDLTEWTEKADDIAESIEGTDDALEYSKEVLRIAGKLTEVSE